MPACHVVVVVIAYSSSSSSYFKTNNIFLHLNALGNQPMLSFSPLFLFPYLMASVVAVVVVGVVECPGIREVSGWKTCH